MVTNAPPMLVDLAHDWQDCYSSAVFAGIVGDLAHQAEGGYHISIQNNPAGNYSIVRPDDAAPPGGWARDQACAIDMSLSLSDMKLCHGRLVAVWNDRANDPRAKFINAHNGWDGAPDGPGRYDWFSGNIKAATSDHKWHVHLEIRRRYWNDRVAYVAILSILRGETLAEYLGKEDEMQLSGPDPFDTNNSLGPNGQAAQLRDGWALLMSGYQPKAATNGGVVARLQRVESALSAVASQAATNGSTLSSLSSAVAGLSQKVAESQAGNGLSDEDRELIRSLKASIDGLAPGV